jgi:hypothetical protein
MIKKILVEVWQNFWNYSVQEFIGCWSWKLDIRKSKSKTRVGKEPTNISQDVILLQAYDKPNPIDTEKKKDLLSLLLLIRPIYYPFYHKLKTKTKNITIIIIHQMMNRFYILIKIPITYVMFYNFFLKIIIFFCMALQFIIFYFFYFIIIILVILSKYKTG